MTGFCSKYKPHSEIATIAEILNLDFETYYDVLIHGALQPY